jgi:hypothetical protein
MTRIPSLAALAIIAVAIVCPARFATGESPADTRLFECTVFPPDLTATQLRNRFGRDFVVDGAVYVGEGESQPGDIVFPNSADSRVEIVWRDQNTRSRPEFVTVRTKTSRWRSKDGLRIGLDLRQVERINRRPFRLTGFGWDYGGTASWNGGAIGRGDGGGCTIAARFDPTSENDPPRIVNQVLGEREFSSGHPAMQAVNPLISQLTLVYQR